MILGAPRNLFAGGDIFQTFTNPLSLLSQTHTHTHMADSRLTAHQVCGQMRGISNETDSSDESSQGAAVDVIFSENMASPLPEDGVVRSPAEPSTSRGATCRAADVGGTTTHGSGIPFPSSGKSPTGVTSVPSAFGITYKERRATSLLQEGYDLPSGPAFADEDEFEQEMGTEFRVASGFSTDAGMIAADHVISRTQDTSEAHGTGGGDEDTTRRSQEQEELLSGGLHLEAIQSTPGSSLLSITELGKPAGNGSLELREAGVATPSCSRDSKLDSEQALKQVANKYKQQEGPAPKRSESLTQALDPSSAQREEGLNGDSQANVTEVCMHISKDVRQYPVMEEEDEQDGEGGEGEDEEVEERGGGDGWDPKGTAAKDLPSDPDTKRAGEKEQQSERDDQDDDARRALVAREWEVIDQLRMTESAVPMEIGVGGSLQPLSIDEGNRVISTQEALRYFRSQDLTIHKAIIIPFQPQETRFGLFRRTPTLKFPDGKTLRDEVFLFAQVQYTWDDVVHRRLIQTIYKRLTNEQRTCPGVGSHWDTIGFQGTDPSTDLNRSMGIFSLLQVLFMLETQATFAIFLYRLSLADVTGWPFLCVSIGFTKEALGVLRRGSCYAECNRRETVLEIVNELHQAQFHAFSELCRTEPATHHALHLSKVRSRTETDPHAMVKAYRAYLSERKASSAKGLLGKTGGSEVARELSQFSRGDNATDEGQRLPVGGDKDRTKQYMFREKTPLP